MTKITDHSYEVGAFCFDFKSWKGVDQLLYPGYNGTDDAILGIVRNGKLLELYSTEEDDDYTMINPKRLRIEDMDWRVLEYLHRRLVDDEYLLGDEVLDYALEIGLCVEKWVEWYVNKHQYLYDTNKEFKYIYKK